MSHQAPMPAKLYAFALIGILIAALIVWVAFQGGNPNRELSAVEMPELPEASAQLRDQAFKLQRQGQWCKARDQWSAFQASFTEDDLLSYWQPEIEANLTLCQHRCEPATGEFVEPGEELDIEGAEGKATVSSDDLLKYYPQGKQVQGLGLMDTTGIGSNQDWGILRINNHFFHSAQVTTQQRVLENDGDVLRIELSLPVVAENLLITKEAWKLEMPSSELLDELFGLMDLRLAIFPGYRVLRKLGETLQAVDPGAEKTLSWFLKRLRAAGVEFEEDRDQQLIQQVESLAGHTFEFVYVPGFGVKSIEASSGTALPKSELLNLARRSGVLTDFVFAEVLDRTVEETFPIKVEEVSRLLGLGYDVDAHGTLQLRREPDEGGLAVMSVLGGEVIIEMVVDGTERKGVLRPKSGIVKYDPQSLILTLVTIDWAAKLNYVSQDHLLFGTENAKNIETRSHYHARLVTAEEQP